jgi:hypothetical protein
VRTFISNPPQSITFILSTLTTISHNRQFQQWSFTSQYRHSFNLSSLSHSLFGCSISNWAINSSHSAVFYQC